MADFELLYISGLSGNYLRQAASVTPSDADSLFPIASLYDGQPDQIFRWGSNGADRLWTADLNGLANPGFESSTLASWTELKTGTGGVTAEETTTIHGGAKALRCNGGASSGTAARYQDFEARAGQRRRHVVWIRGNGTQGARVRIQNLVTGKWWNGSAWVSSAADAATESGASYVEKSLDYQVEARSVCLQRHVTIRVTYISTENGDAFFDDAADFPAVNFLGLYGHNVAPVVAPQLRSSTDGFSAVDTLEGTLTPQRPSCFAFLSTAVYRQWWRLKLSGTNVETPWIGVAVLGHAEVLAAARGWGYETTHRLDQLRNRAPSGRQIATALGGEPRRAVRWGFPMYAEADWQEIRDDVYDRSGHGQEPVVFAVRDSDADQLTIHGRLTEEVAVRRAFIEAWEAQVLVEEDPFPIILD